MNVDFYAGNLHKWAYSCKGTAFMWVNPLHQGYIHPLNTSHTYKLPFPDEFYSRGTNDSATKYIAATNALEFYERYEFILLREVFQMFILYLSKDK